MTYGRIQTIGEFDGRRMSSMKLLDVFHERFDTTCEIFHYTSDDSVSTWDRELKETITKWYVEALK